MVNKSNIHYSKIYQKGNRKKNIQFPLELQENETSEAPSSALHLEGFNIQLNSLKNKWILRLLNLTHAFWKDLMLYWLKLILNSNKGLVLFRQTQILKSTRHKNLQKQNKRIFLYSCLILGYISPAITFLSSRISKKFLNRPSFEIHTPN